jgi:hypothetical protein
MEIVLISPNATVDRLKEKCETQSNCTWEQTLVSRMAILKGTVDYTLLEVMPGLTSR